MLHQIFLHKGQKWHSYPLSSKWTHKSYKPGQQGKREHGPELEYTPKEKRGQMCSVCYKRSAQMSVGLNNLLLSIIIIILSSLTNDQRDLWCHAQLPQRDHGDSEWLSSDYTHFQKIWLFRYLNWKLWIYPEFDLTWWNKRDCIWNVSQQWSGWCP